jgi:phenylacetate-coenzyme A ligase PaaK-like adenylate-forming protein
MGWKSKVIRPFASFIAKKVKKERKTAIENQQEIFRYLIRKGQNTQFGKDHGFEKINSPEDFRELAAIRDYEMIKPYIEKIIDGQQDVLWPGTPIYFSKTSGTTSGTKYIPLTRASLPNHINSARNALMMYVDEFRDASVFDGKLIFISGSPELDKTGAIPTGRLSGIVNHHVPKWAKKNQLPTYATNCIEDWETKIDRIVDETLKADMRLISGIPPWVLMYYEKLMEKTGKHIKDIFPNFKVFVHGGVNFAPYAASLEEAVGKPLPIIETYPASEGFIAFKDSQHSEGLLLNTNSGIYFEFVPAQEIFEENPRRLTLSEVELNTNYALIINNNAGLWGYNIGDTVKFVSLDPFRIEVTGRIKHFISAFGEHVIAEEVEKSILNVADKQHIDIVEFTVAPQVNPPVGELPYHEWFVEFGKQPKDIGRFAVEVDNYLRKLNSYYDDLISGGILQPLVMKKLKPESFRNYMKSKGKLGGQNKVPRLSNDRLIADELKSFQIN